MFRNQLYRGGAVLLLAALTLLSSTSLLSQTQTSTILGTVVDPQKSLIVGAAVTVVSEGTGEQRKAASDASGGFSFAGLQPGTYTLRVENAGFQTYQRTGVTLTASERLSVGAIQMNVGSVAETMTVTADAAVVSDRQRGRFRLAQLAADRDHFPARPQRYQLPAIAAGSQHRSRGSRSAEFNGNRHAAAKRRRDPRWQPSVSAWTGCTVRTTAPRVHTPPRRVPSRWGR